jgi:ligand-binding SRPBCC domain-containing protein
VPAGFITSTTELAVNFSSRLAGFFISGLLVVSTIYYATGFSALLHPHKLYPLRAGTRYDNSVTTSGVHHFITEQFVPFPVELVFAFFANPQNLPHLMPQRQKTKVEQMRLQAPPQRPLAENPRLRFRSMAAGAGTELDISFSPVPFVPGRIGWQGVIREFEWNSHFIDEQQKGPFKSWRHTHRFRTETHPDPREDHTGCMVTGTVVSDDLEYALPLGPIGIVLNALLFRSRLESLFDYRQQRLAEILPIAAKQAGL